ncbi:MAG TPA: hypothetical protein DIC52_24845, partial [Candidatus Latescibacteria bacterium]|nr:hypothetical protein [Candidatus Latescibacterota bacterium]
MSDTPLRFQRCTVHWCPPQRLDLVEHVREARLQMVQAGNFGPMFYGLADDPEVERWFPGQPLLGIEANLDYMRDLICRVQAEGARYVGTMSMSWNYGDHETAKGLWQVWAKLWTAELLGAQAPCDDPAQAMQVDESGTIRHWPIDGRPYRTYSGCMANPLWRSTLKSMISKAILDLGVDGFNVHHGFENLCRCQHCRAWLWPRLSAVFSTDERVAAFGADTVEEAGDLLQLRQDCPASLRPRVSLEIERAAAHLRKATFDDLFVEYGRSLKSDLLLAQWYHKYNFKPRDERSLLPADLWSRDESYLWYSQGSQKGVTYFDHGWLADMGLPARFLHAAAAGRPFIINKYDWERWRLSIAEMAAHGGAGLAVHWAPHGEGDRNAGAEQRYRTRVYPYQRFLAEHEELFAGARPYSELAMLYPRRGEVAADSTATDALRRIGTLLENEHFLFDMVLDEQLSDRGAGYDALILADIRRMSPAEVAWMRWWVQERDGQVMLVGDNGTLREDGRRRSESPFAEWIAQANGNQVTRVGRGQVLAIGEGAWTPDRVEVKAGVEIDVYPMPGVDDFGRELIARIDELVEGRWLLTDAPWFVRVRAWRTEDRTRICLHWLNYRQVENLDDEVPLEQGPFDATLRLPISARAERLEWLDPEIQGSEELDFQRHGAQISFTVPQITIYGIAVVHL